MATQQDAHDHRGDTGEKNERGSDAAQPARRLGPRRDGAEQRADDEAEDGGDQQQSDGPWEGLGDHLGYGRRVFRQRVAEIEVDDVLQVLPDPECY